MAITSYDNKLPPPPAKYNILKIGNENESALSNLLFEYEKLDKDNDPSNCHIYYTFNDGSDKWSEYIELVNKKELDELTAKMGQVAFDHCYPVGCTYVQYPGCPEPNKLFLNDLGIKCWWDIIDYDGAFFRAEGKDASLFISQGGTLTPQAEGFPDIQGSIKSKDWYKGQTMFESGATLAGVFKSSRITSNTIVGASDWSGYCPFIDPLVFKASDSNPIYGRSNGVTPKNYTIRVWKRIS